MCFTSIQDVLKTPNIISFEENTKCNALVLHRALVMQITIVLFTVLVIDLYPQRLSTSIHSLHALTLKSICTPIKCSISSTHFTIAQFVATLVTFMLF